MFEKFVIHKNGWEIILLVYLTVMMSYIEFHLKLIFLFVSYGVITAVKPDCPSNCKCLNIYTDGSIGAISCPKLKIINATQQSGMLSINCDISKDFKLYDGIFTDYGSGSISKYVALSLTNCSLENLTQKTLFPSLDKLVVAGTGISRKQLYGKPFQSLRYMLTLEELTISDTLLTILNSSVLTGIEQIKYLNVQYNDKLTKIGNGTFTELHGLKTLVLSHNHITHVDNDTFAGLTNLRTLDLRGNHLSVIPSGIFHRLYLLETLNLQGNQIHKIMDEAFYYLTDIRSIDLSYNHIQRIDGDYPFSWTQNLVLLDLSHNDITIVQQGISWQQSLKYLLLSHNKISGFESVGKHGTIHASALQSMDQLTELQLSNNNLTTIDFWFFYRTGSIPQVWIDMGISDDSGIAADKGHVLTVYIGNNPLFCDCRLYDLLSFIQKKTHTKDNLRFYYQELKCQGPKELENKDFAEVDSKQLYCDITTQCDEECDCAFFPFNNSTIINCAFKNFTNIPLQLPNNTTKLDLRGNKFTSVPDLCNLTMSEIDLQSNQITNCDNVITANPTLKVLSLRGNNLTALSKDILRSNLTLKRLKIGHNPWHCNCNTIDMKYWILNNSAIIKDIPDIRCQSGIDGIIGKIIVNINDSLFGCPVEHKTYTIPITLAITFFFLLVILVILVLYKCNMKIRIWMYSKFGASFFRKHEESEDKVFDVFISYSRHDESLVVRQLVPWLENHSPPFKTCVHYRDFIPGGCIANSIVEAVENSRRILLLLSQNFIDSEWCQFEFKAAHHRVLKDRLNRLIVIVVDEIPSNLDPDMKLYLSTNTYVRWDDNWFWEKLLYALPNISKRTKTVMQSNAETGSPPSISPRSSESTATTDITSIDVDMSSLPSSPTSVNNSIASASGQQIDLTISPVSNTTSTQNMTNDNGDRTDIHVPNTELFEHTPNLSQANQSVCFESLV